MTSTAVIFIERATPATLTNFKDALANDLLSTEGTWSLEFRTYRTQIKNYSEDSRSKLMYTMNFSHHDENTIIIKNKLGFLLSSDVSISNKITDDNRVQNLVENDCSTGFPESFDILLGNKLTNMWEQRQILRGDAGETFKTMNCLIRCINLFSSTGFKGLIIEIEDITKDCTNETFTTRINEIKELLTEITIKEYQISQDTLNDDEINTDSMNQTDYLCNLAYQYVRVLEY
ncbi:similar to Saccharomyces cerevisiae YHR041C SRB2 Subunit of the RNA polymerase II mediator complex [Maudiozyma saulgeensis]|uniref:Mediator of RNA polymerase II transcription subunit 20 n=1 Tax=Maudiozyma saulgeensis TaxID=1789683 RepID=A0A1X7QYK9_9SACH|nr:similar to Saccharomyces cerevisiae YHR041C SRB2 Subunit of the RNA polymerase II mediator complex [Kazachstania saulgeensis]